jgi:hypothetical protein
MTRFSWRSSDPLSGRALKLGVFCLLLTLGVSASAKVDPSSISGVVKNSAGVPQMGALVELIGVSAPGAYTDSSGFYEIRGLPAGSYSVKVSAASFLPSLRENLTLKTGVNLVVNVTLNTLFEAVQMLPARKGPPSEDNDWRWTLRSSANRPVLRVVDEGPLMVVSNGELEGDRVLKAKVAFVGGSGSGFGSSSDMSTAFSVEQSIFTGGTISLDGKLGVTGSGSLPNTVVRAAYRQNMRDGSRPEIAITARRLNAPKAGFNDASALQALALSMSNTMSLSPTMELNYGGQLESIQFIDRMTAFRPFATLDWHVSPDWMVEYRYSSSVPTTRLQKGFNTAPADLSESGPRATLVNFDPAIENARHQEISVSHRAGKNNVQVAVFHDRVKNVAMTGVGEVAIDEGDFLPDVYSETFNYNGGNLNTTGMRVIYSRQLTEKLISTLDYAFGGVLVPTSTDLTDVRSTMRKQRRHAISYKMAGQVPGSHAKWIASYTFTNGDSLTPVDMFNTSPGQSDPYLSVFVRQPLPETKFIPGKVEAMVDVRNLLAQGYMPVVGNDGQTVYLVSAARSVRGGLAFTF